MISPEENQVILATIHQAFLMGKREVVEEVLELGKIHSEYSMEVNWARQRILEYAREELAKLNE